MTPDLTDDRMGAACLAARDAIRAQTVAARARLDADAARWADLASNECRPSERDAWTLRSLPADHAGGLRGRTAETAAGAPNPDPA